MARGKTSAEMNLINKDTRFSGRIAVENQKKSVAARKENKRLRECLTTLMEQMYTNDNGEQMTGTEMLSVVAMRKALDGDPKWWQIVRDTSGQKPSDKIDVDDKVIEYVNPVYNMSMEEKFRLIREAAAEIQEIDRINGKL